MIDPLLRIALYFAQYNVFLRYASYNSHCARHMYEHFFKEFLMPITPHPEAMITVTQLMAKTLGVLHEIIEIEHEHPKEAMVLMMAFITGVAIQVKDKLETLEPKLGEQLLDAVGMSLNPTGRKTIEKLNKNDPSLNKSASGIAPNDLIGAVNFLMKRLSSDISSHLDELPFTLRNDVTVLHSLSAVVGDIFNKFAVRDLDTSIEDFVKNIRIFAGKTGQNNAFDKKCH